MVPAAFASSDHSARIVWTRRRGGSTSRFSPSPSSMPPAFGLPISKRPPGVQSEVIEFPNWYLLRVSLSVIASQRRSGVVRM